MTAQQATTEVFWTAFKALPRTAREDFLAHLASDPDLRQDLMDIALIERRGADKSRPFSEYLAERSGRR